MSGSSSRNVHRPRSGRLCTAPELLARSRRRIHTFLSMFRRRSSEPDVAEAARRRLAQLAVEFAASSPPPGLSSPAASSGTDSASTAPSVSPDTATDRSTADRSTARHPPSPPVPPGRHAALSSSVGALGRLRVTAHHVAATAVAVLVLVAVAGWMWWHSRPVTTTVSAHPTPLSTVGAPTRSAGASPTPAAHASGTPPPRTNGAQVVVDVEGKVRRPGIVELPSGSRVVDAIRAAGGAGRRRQLRTVNLARPLVDGEQILVGITTHATGPPLAAGTPGAGGSPPPQRVDLNTATQDQLEALPQVGPVTAQAIIAWRTENGSFTSVDELLDVTGIGDKTLAQLRPYVYV
jgi:competence protein ComEA